jgi:hypothetical protein
MVALHLEAG